MDLTGKPVPGDSTRQTPPRAGLRVALDTEQPTNLFEAIEMAVLVIVTALAMVSIIVAGSEDDARRTALPAHGGVERTEMAHEAARAESRPSYASAEPGRPVSVATNR